MTCFALDGLKGMSKGIGGNRLVTQKYVKCLYIPGDRDGTKQQSPCLYEAYILMGMDKE